MAWNTLSSRDLFCVLHLISVFNGIRLFFYYYYFFFFSSFHFNLIWFGSVSGNCCRNVCINGKWLEIHELSTHRRLIFDILNVEILCETLEVKIEWYSHCFISIQFKWIELQVTKFNVGRVLQNVQLNKYVNNNLLSQIFTNNTYASPCNGTAKYNFRRQFV